MRTRRTGPGSIAPGPTNAAGRGRIMTKTNAAAAMGLTLAALLGPCFGAAAQSAQPLPADVVKQDIRDIEEMYQRRVEQTPFPGLYRADMAPASGARRASPVIATPGAEAGAHKNRTNV